MATAPAALGGLARRRVAWVALLALLFNVTIPTLALRAMPPADMFAAALCHAPGGAPQQQQDDQGQQSPGKGTCPLCMVFAGQALAVLPSVPVVLPRPVAYTLATPRGPPVVAALPAESRPPGARGPPFLA